MSKKSKWRLCIISILVVVIFAFSPLAIQYGKNKPELFSIPYSLWLSILLTVVAVIITYIGTKVLPDNEEDEL